MEKRTIKKGNCTIEVEADLSNSDKPKMKIKTKGDCKHINLGDTLNEGR